MLETDPRFKVFRGAFIQSISDQRAEFIPDGLVLVASAGEDCGRIVAMGETARVAAAYGLELKDESPGQGTHVAGDLWLPAFFDTHFHWVQDAVREMAKYSLIEWLNNITFPEEAKFADAAFADRQAKQFWESILSLGTVGGLCYSSIHEVALDAAMQWAPADFYIGNVLMTMECPDYLQQSEADAIAIVQSCARRYGRRYIASPRFAPTTAPAVMRAAAEAAQANAAFQQTHLGETLAEIDWVLDIYRKLPGFEDVGSYTEIYQRVGMLGEQSVFGHCIHLTADEWRLLAESGSRIASCPTSNAPVENMGLGSGLFDYPTAEAYGVPWSLASDIGGGPYLSMFDVMHSFVWQNRAIGRADATYTKALHRATSQGAKLMDLPDRGVLREGAFFDAIRLRMPQGQFTAGDAEPILAAFFEQIPDRKSTETLVQETFVKGESRFKRGASTCD
ncbi:MAG: guanine deaminase [Puniceicoccaceae bacterium]|nr:MAG: guanine deaminase [Puniceicoccaceae bacterium]